jgi:hypothetical protein
VKGAVAVVVAGAAEALTLPHRDIEEVGKVVVQAADKVVF